jgi:hypothetical protein
MDLAPARSCHLIRPGESGIDGVHPGEFFALAAPVDIAMSIERQWAPVAGTCPSPDLQGFGVEGDGEQEGRRTTETVWVALKETVMQPPYPSVA